jgi:RHS repeat-associated protein
VDYIYGGVKPHAASLIGAETLNYDGNGNLLTSTDTFSGTYRIHHWDDENRLRLISGKADVAYYLYDATGERTQKLLADYQQMQINDSTTVEGYISNSQTLYVNPYLVVNNQEYTKHYYIENQRIISKLGGGFTIDSVPLFSLVYGFDLNSLNAYNEKKLDLETMVGNDLDSCDLPTAFIIDNGLYDFLSQQEGRQDDESEIYYYHPDHLGSTSYITNVNGMTSQHIDYTPFGEVLLEETMGGWLTPYKFNAKEMDGESGLYYYGARYYDPGKVVFYGVDPLGDKFPGWSCYAYCLNNPIRLIDQDGMEPGGPDDPPISKTQNPAIKEGLIYTKGKIDEGSYSLPGPNIIGNSGAVSGGGGEKLEPWLTVNFNRGIPQIETNFTVKDWGAITPGPFIAYPKGGSKDKYYNTHEPGHVIQFLILGPVAYYGLVAIPSLITSTTPYHSDMPWEKSANQLWYWLTGENDPRNPLYFGPNKK